MPPPVPTPLLLRNRNLVASGRRGMTSWMKANIKKLEFFEVEIFSKYLRSWSIWKKGFLRKMKERGTLRTYFGSSNVEIFISNPLLLQLLYWKFKKLSRFWQCNESKISIHASNLLPDETEEMLIEKFSYFGSSKFQCGNFQSKSGQKYAKLRMEVLKMAP
jgi:hypothetical protein